VKFETQDLINRITTERSKHRKIFEEAVENYKSQVLEELEDFAERVKRGERIRIVSTLPVPEEHTDDYDMVLDMLCMTTDKTIELTEEQFNTYVRGRWHWMASFASNTMSYNR
jgi:hypothetical protein